MDNVEMNVADNDKSYYRAIAWALIILGCGLRFLLFWYNSPDNSYDNHFEPIVIMTKLGIIPAKDACFQCYQPPVFYFISALVAKACIGLGFGTAALYKVLQFVNALYAMLTLVVLYSILKRVPVSGFARLLALGTVCFLPRHIYMSAMHSNDTISYFGVALSILLLLIAFERKLPYRYLVLLSLSVAFTIFTKYTAFVVLPALFAAFAMNFIRCSVATRKRTLVSVVVVFLFPVLLLGAYSIANMKEYGKALPWNDSTIDTASEHPRAEGGTSFTTLKPWTTIGTPIIVPGNMDSFWTLIYSRMWFDMEPMFLDLIDPDRPWWNQYYSWLRGEAPFPSAKSPLSTPTRLTGSLLITLGLVPLVLSIVGLIYYVFRWLGSRGRGVEYYTLPVFLLLMLFNGAGVLLLGFKAPVYSSMKAAYFLSSIPAFAVFLAYGVTAIEKRKKVKYLLAIIFSLLFALVTLHILHIAVSVATR
ncbi:MAG: glycosyltransferase family 39 protein [Proteobacteria bacterium]|nr:glycosyltransferase family 39 protein [Pseudomonadota bacterium]